MFLVISLHGYQEWLLDTGCVTRWLGLGLGFISDFFLDIGIFDALGGARVYPLLVGLDPSATRVCFVNFGQYPRATSVRVCNARPWLSGASNLIALWAPRCHAILVDVGKGDP